MNVIAAYMDCLEIDEETAKAIVSKVQQFKNEPRKIAIHDPHKWRRDISLRYPQRGSKFFEDNFHQLIFSIAEDSISKVISEITSFLGGNSDVAVQKWRELCAGGAFTLEEFRTNVKLSLSGYLHEQEVEKTVDLFLRLWDQGLIVEETYLGV